MGYVSLDLSVWFQIYCLYVPIYSSVNLLCVYVCAFAYHVRMCSTLTVDW